MLPDGQRLGVRPRPALVGVISVEFHLLQYIWVRDNDSQVDVYWRQQSALQLEFAELDGLQSQTLRAVGASQTGQANPPALALLHSFYPQCDMKS